MQIDSSALGQVGGAPRNTFYNTTLNSLLSRAGIQPGFVQMEVIADFRQTAITYRGGIAGHGVLFLDGKYLDILADLAAYRALSDLGRIARNDVPALDLIVVNHNSVLGASSNLRNFQILPGDAQAIDLATRYFDSYVGMILYHEYSHIFLYHTLDNCAGQISQALFGIPYQPVTEDEADIAAGILADKVGLNESVGFEAYDMMAFYAGHQRGTAPSILQVASFSEQFQRAPGYSSLAGRKSLYQQGFAFR